jgi:hypothetical protein
MPAGVGSRMIGALKIGVAAQYLLHRAVPVASLTIRAA